MAESRNPRRSNEDNPPQGSPPESAMGGASDSGAHGPHPASSAAAKREHLPAEPDRALGDAVIERRRRLDPEYRGPERRVGRR